MLKKNISSDAINCDCCELESNNKVLELEHIFQFGTKRTAIVPLSLRMILEGRLENKKGKHIQISARTSNHI